MDNAFVPLDLANSDLRQGQPSKTSQGTFPKGSLVLVGGPGAGKSTLVKHFILSELQRGRRSMPLFLRLRDYVGFENLEAAISHYLASFKFPEAADLLQRLLQAHASVCVLDGLDEVKPELRPQVLADINTFYHKYFSRHGRLVVTCRKEAYRDTPLDIPIIMEVRPLSDDQIRLFAQKWPPGFPQGKSPSTFWRDLTAAQRIHELARSPLLLVGGLMQYTESNQGIPDERFQYLQRVAKWLIADWSTAQGHPPDPLRPLYDRILPRLAFEMHSRRTAEVSLAEARAMITSWLPRFGFSDTEADKVIISLRTRTGILIGDDKHNLVFCQFGLQEFFASVDLAGQVRPAEVGSLQPIAWWREAILLGVAQQRDPGPYLDAIFVSDPFLAAAAVAECPTPSTAQQQKAVDACLRGIARADQSVTGALVPLLRKVKGSLESQLCLELERRLKEPKRRARIVGLALATAGTEAATTALAKHPEIWEECLRSAGYLSENFESLLFQWIQDGSDDQSARAAEILSGRLRENSLSRLLDLLPNLSARKADNLASLLLAHAANATDNPFTGLMLPTRLIASCVPYIDDPEEFLRKMAGRSLTKGRKGRMVEALTAPAPLTAALFLRKRSGRRFTVSEIESTFAHALSWCRLRLLIYFGLLSGCGLVAASAANRERLLLACLILLGLFVVVCLPPPSLPWNTKAAPWFTGRYRRDYRSDAVWNLGVMAVTGFTVAAMLGRWPATLLLASSLITFLIGMTFSRVPHIPDFSWEMELRGYDLFGGYVVRTRADRLIDRFAAGMALFESCVVLRRIFGSSWTAREYEAATVTGLGLIVSLTIVAIWLVLEYRVVSLASLTAARFTREEMRQFGSGSVWFPRTAAWKGVRGPASKAAGRSGPN